MLSVVASMSIGAGRARAPLGSRLLAPGGGSTPTPVRRITKSSRHVKWPGPRENQLAPHQRREESDSKWVLETVGLIALIAGVSAFKAWHARTYMPWKTTGVTLPESPEEVREMMKAKYGDGDGE
eukprot:SAG31_NODE_3082_length_4698_cov_1.855838_3_plen_125_part_00